MSQENIQVVMSAFEAAMHGDVEASSKFFTEDHVLEASYPAHLPFGRGAKGPAETAALMQQMAGAFERVGMNLREFVTQGETVIAIVEEDLRAHATGKRFKNNNLLWAKVRDGKVYFSRFFADTFAVSESLRKDEAPARTARSKKNAVKNSLKAATTGKARAGKSASKNKVQPAAKKAKAGARKSTARARR